MKDIGKKLISENSFSAVMMGNHALVRAFIESGVRVLTSYPGSPTPEITEALNTLPKEENPIYFEFSVNEKVATEVAFGASINGNLSCVFFKSVGLNVAADSFVQLSLMELIGGMVIILGDDPGANSSQNEQDNRHFALMSYIPVFEPDSPSEAYAMFKEAAKLSQENRMPVILRLSTHICHAKERIDFESYQKNTLAYKTEFNPDNGPYIPITSLVFPLKRKALQKLTSVKKYSENNPFNKIINHFNNQRGIICSGLTYLSLMDIMPDLNQKPDVLKMGLCYPIPESLIIDFLNKHQEVKILEELDDIYETQIKAIAYDHQLKVRIIGKNDLTDWENEYTPDKVLEILTKTWPDISHPKADLESQEKDLWPVKDRPAQLCPGCGHRSAFYAIKKALNENDISVADIGCHTLGFLPPYQIGQVLLCMGHSNGTAAGLSLFNTQRKVISFLGDSTFFHAGIPGIINAIFNKHKHTLIIMENGTTAMTGHQEHPATGKNFNEITEKIPLRQVLEGLGVTHIWEVDTYQQDKLTLAVKEALSEDMFNVVIAKHPCMLKFTRELRRKGNSTPKPVKIGTKCNLSYKCLSEFACPSYQIKENGEVWVQTDLCIGDGSCKQTCPSLAIESQIKE